MRILFPLKKRKKEKKKKNATRLATRRRGKKYVGSPAQEFVAEQEAKNHKE